MSDPLSHVVMFLIGFALMALIRYEWAVWRQFRRPPSSSEIKDLRRALATWAEAYKKADPKPHSKYFKHREAELFRACCKVGLIWINPDRQG